MAMADNFGTPVRLDASGVVSARPCSLIGFLCTASSTGSITLYDHATGATGTAILNALPVTAGQFTHLRIATANGCYATLDGSAAGTFVVIPML